MWPKSYYVKHGYKMGMNYLGGETGHHKNNHLQHY